MALTLNDIERIMAPRLEEWLREDIRRWDETVARLRLSGGVDEGWLLLRKALQGGKCL